MEIIKRDKYLQKIRRFIDKPVIKIITGMRRTGKSFFLKQVIDELKNNGIKDDQILYIDKDSLAFDHIKDYKDLDNFVNKNFKKKKKRYLFIDEVQEIDEWQKAILSFFNEANTDIFITGSNAHMLSSELATRLSGRYIEFPIYSLSFKEFLDDFRKNPSKDIEEEFQLYIRFGGFPAIHNFELKQESIYPYIASIFDTVVLKDVVAKNEIRNIKLLENIIDFVLDNIGSTFSAKSIADYLKSQRLSVGVETIQNYLAYLEAAYIVQKVPRYDLKGKRILEIYEKYYLNDLGIRHARLGFRKDDISDYLENLVYFELIRRGYKVKIGKLSDLEIDFIAEKDEERIYIQVCYTLYGEKTKGKSIKERESDPFFKLIQESDFNTKLLISTDKISGSNELEIFQTMNIIEFLLNESLVRRI
jgi:predicted AAA+ superfamily ATPase